MYPCFSRSDCNTSDIDDISNIQSSIIYDNDESILICNQSLNNTKKVDSSMENLLKDLFPDIVETSTRKMVDGDHEFESQPEQLSTSASIKQININIENEQNSNEDCCNINCDANSSLSLQYYLPDQQCLSQNQGSLLEDVKSISTNAMLRLFADTDGITSVEMVTSKSIENLDESEIFIKKQPSACSVKRKYVAVENEQDIDQSDKNKKYCDTNSIVDTKEHECAELPSIVHQEVNSQIYDKFEIPEELNLITSSHHISKIYSYKSIENIYEYAIKKISTDDTGILRRIILSEFKDKIKSKKFNQSRMDYSLTCSKIRKYIVDIVSPYINSIIQNSDALITPGMSIEDIRDNYISNDVFFNKLHKCCEEISKDIHRVPLEEFSTIIQSNISFGQGYFIKTNMNTIAASKKLRISKALKYLVLSNLRKLPKKIISVIKNFETIDVFKGTFILLHNVYVIKSFIIDIMKIHDDVEKAMMKNRSLKFDYSLAKTKLEEAINKLVILHEGKVFLPNKSMTKLMIEHLLLDATKIYYRFSYKLFSHSLLWSPDNVGFIGVYRFATLMINPNTVYKQYPGKNIIKDYMAEIVNTFMNEFKEKIEVKIKLYHGMDIGELELAYTSNEEFFNGLREHCRTINDSLNNDDNIIDRIIGPNLRSKLSKKEAINLTKFVSKLLIYNISNLPEKIANAIKLLPKSHLVSEFFSLFHNIYVDNISLLKAKSVFVSVQEKINDHLQSCGDVKKRCKNLDKDVIISELVEEQLIKLKKELDDHNIMIICNNKVSIADEETKNIILSKFKLDLMVKSLIDN